MKRLLLISALLFHHSVLLTEEHKLVIEYEREMCRETPLLVMCTTSILLSLVFCASCIYRMHRMNDRFSDVTGKINDRLSQIYELPRQSQPLPTLDSQYSLGGDSPTQTPKRNSGDVVNGNPEINNNNQAGAPTATTAPVIINQYPPAQQPMPQAQPVRLTPAQQAAMHTITVTKATQTNK